MRKFFLEVHMYSCTLANCFSRELGSWEVVTIILGSWTPAHAYSSSWWLLVSEEDGWHAHTHTHTHTFVLKNCGLFGEAGGRHSRLEMQAQCWYPTWSIPLSLSISYKIDTLYLFPTIRKRYTKGLCFFFRSGYFYTYMQLQFILTRGAA